MLDQFAWKESSNGDSQKGCSISLSLPLSLSLSLSLPLVPFGNYLGWETCFQDIYGNEVPRS